ncbi:hypothetical protein [Streptomyces sp. NPDC055912]|uniref:hypothetical protein n=1 Tax=Streptomyces sp. NPDC055912 TaxID=3345660 RepID=UPI0035DB40BE
MAAQNGRKQNRRGVTAATKAASPGTAPGMAEARTTADGIIAEAEKLAGARVAEAVKEAEAAVGELLDEAQKTADSLQSDAEKSAEQVRNSAQESAHELLAEARRHSEELLQASRTDAEKLSAEAAEAAAELRERREAEAEGIVAEATAKAEQLLAAAAQRAVEVRAQAQTSADDLLDEARAKADQIRADAEGALASGRADAQKIRAEADAEADRARRAGTADRDRAQSEAASVRAETEQLRQHAEGTARALRKQAEETADRIRLAVTDEIALLRRDVAEEAEHTRRAAADEAGRLRTGARTAVAESEKLAEHVVVQAREEAAGILARAENQARELTAQAETAMQDARAARVQANADADTLRKEAAQDRDLAAEELERALSPTLRKLEKRNLRDDDAERRRVRKRKEKDDLAEQRRTSRAQRKAGRPTVVDRVQKFFRDNARRLMVVGPISAPMAVAWSSQTSYAMDAFGWWLIAALGFAAAWELTTTFTAWMYHQSRSQGDSGLIYRFMTWVFAAGAAAMNYAHHCGPDGRPTQAAVAFATMSIVGMILWELYASLLHREHARAEGRVAKARPRIGLIRWVRYPRQSWTAWSLTINNQALDTLEKAWEAADRSLAQAGMIRHASGLNPLRRAVAALIGVGQWVPVRSLPPVPRTWRVLPVSGAASPSGIPAYAVLERVSVSAEILETETRAALPIGETLRSHETCETGSHARTADETGTIETRETGSRETAETGSHGSRTSTETGETGSGETRRDRSHGSRDADRTRSRRAGDGGSPREMSAGQVSPLRDKPAEVQRLLDVMWARGDGLAVQLGSKSQPGEAEEITGCPRSTAGKRLAEARALFAAGHRTYSETETRATGTDG